MFITNSLGRAVPDELGGRKYNPYQGVPSVITSGKNSVDFGKFGRNSKVTTLEDAIRQSDMRDGATVSFHHHLRNGDYVMNLVMTTLAKIGFKDLNVVASSFFPINEPLVQLIKDGVITGVDTDYCTGPVADAISMGLLAKPAIFRSHGARARAIDCGEIKIDMAFIGAPCADNYGNANGVGGKSPCGSMGYAFPDARMAEKVVVVTDSLVEYPLFPISISQTHVDYVVVVDSIGDPHGIVSGITRITTDPDKLSQAEIVADVIQGAGLLRDGFSFQTGGGGTSLAVAKYIHEKMKQDGITGSFGGGGITGYFVKMLEEGIFRSLLDVQCLDLEAVDSLRRNPNHIEVDASFYANPFNKGCWVNKLDTMVLGATEVDVNFNINVLTNNKGVIMGGSGGNADTAAGCRLAVVVLPSFSKTIPRIVKQLKTIVTPGETIDVVVTELGVAVNPRRADLQHRLRGIGLNLVDIHDMQEMVARKISAPATPTKPEESKIVGLVEYRDGSIIDVVRAVQEM